MPKASPDLRSPLQRSRDEQIAVEPMLSPPGLEDVASPRSVESFLTARRPLAVAGVVENGLIRPLDPNVKLAEHSRVIIVAVDE